MSDIKSISDIGLISVSDLSGMNFFIPSYQRGYRWTEQQVKDLLNDINEFDPKDDGYYCLQPLVVEEITEKKEKYGLGEREWYEVIDGQQRLTTIFLILKLLGKSLYKLRYATREGSETFLGEVGSQGGEETESVKEEEGNIDYYHIGEAYKCIKSWFDEHGNIMDVFADKLLNGTRFIWYKTEEDPVEVFTRINMRKIPLTNGELVKALFLNRMNFGKDEKIQSLKQQEIAMQWDEIEYALRDNDFWFFFNQGEYKEPTRIDAILDIMRERDDLEVKGHIRKNPDVKGEDDKKVENVLGKGNDKYRTFRYFYYYFKEMSGKSKNVNKVSEPSEDDTEKKEWIGEKGWRIIKGIFQTFKDWYYDIECYHYVSFLVYKGVGIKDIFMLWMGEKNKILESMKQKKIIEGFIEKWDGKMNDQLFLEGVKCMIKDKIAECSDLDASYDQIHDCEPLLLLFNIQTVINQANNLKAKYGNKDFARFPFYIYKKEEWNIEHIDSRTTNDLSDPGTQIEWLANEFDNCTDEKKKKIAKFINEREGEFDELRGGISEEGMLNDEENQKNQIMNFALLDASTNKGYGNSIFSAKRRKIIDKEQGTRTVPKIKDGKVVWKKVWIDVKNTPFIPPCTKNVFLKYYSPRYGDPNKWTKEDARYYKRDIYYTLHNLFGVKSKEIEKEENSNGQE